MTEFVNRHKINISDSYIKSCEKTQLEAIIRLETDAFDVFEQNVYKYNLDDYCNYSLTEFTEYSIISNPDRNIQAKSLYYWSILARAFYTLSNNAGKEVTVTFRRKPVTVVGKQYISYLDINSWLKAWGAFLVLRSAEGRTLLSTMPEEARLRSDLKWDTLDRNITALLSNIATPNAPLAELLLEALQSTDPESGHFDAFPEAVYWVLYIYEPMLQCYSSFLHRDEAKFNEDLKNALELHKQYWDTPKRCNDYDGWISWYLLGPAALAHDEGMKIEVESDYIPSWLVRGEFPKIPKPW